MKTVHALMVLGLGVSPVVAVAADGEVAAKKRAPMTHSAMPEGKTLPQNVWRFRFANKMFRSHFGYDSSGKKVDDTGASAAIDVGAFVVEYGLIPKLSLQLVAPFVHRNNVALNKSDFLKSKTYRAHEEKYISKVAEGLVASIDAGKAHPVCNGVAGCREYIRQGNSLPVPIALNTPTSGEHHYLKAGTPLKEGIRNAILAIADRPTGAIGLGDMEIGALYNFLDDGTFLLSSGAGFRLPTGEFTNTPHTRNPVARGGVTDIAVRLNAAVSPMDGVWISLQEQVETAITKGKWRRTSEIDNGSFNVETPTEKPGNRATFAKKGVESTFFAKVDVGLGAFAPLLKAVTVNTAYTHKLGRATELDGKLDSEVSHLHTVGGGCSVSGLPYGLPLAFDVDYAQPVAGKNQAQAPASLATVLKLYMKF